MNHWQYEWIKQMHEYSRQRRMDEIRSENLVRQYRVYHPGMFARIMFQLANWMISTGRQLRKRYEIPSVNCNQRASGNFI